MEKNEIPSQYQRQWEAVNVELAEASNDIGFATVRYNEAILARIALRRLIDNEQ